MAQTLLGFDFGRIRIGVAVGNTVTGTAEALAIVDSEPLEKRWKEIATLIGQWRPDVLVVGRPTVPADQAASQAVRPVDATSPPTVSSGAASASGADESNFRETAARCERFARQLAGRFRLPVELVDESGSSLEAAAALAAGMRDGAGEHAVRRAGTGQRRKRTAQPEADDAEAAAIILRQYLSRR